MNIISSKDMPVANGHYSPCIEHNGILYISGQLPFPPNSKILPKGIKAQTLQTLKNVEVILKAAGSGRDKVLRVRIYIPDVELWGDVNSVYSEFFQSHKPVRCVVPTGKLHYGALIEIEVEAIV